MNRITTIYALVDPRNNECRYVGKTVNKNNRYNNHCVDSLKENTHKSNWVKSIYPVKPEMIILEEVDCDWIEAEQFWIAYMKSLGARLTNLTLGGEGGLGYKHKPETKKIMSECASNRTSKLRGIKRSSEVLKVVNAAIKEAMQKPEVKEKLRKLKTGIKDSQETKLRKSEALKAFWNTPEGKIKKANSVTSEQIERMRNIGKSALGIPRTDEVKEKIRSKLKGNDNALGFKHTEEALLKIKEAGRNPSEETKLKRRISFDATIKRKREAKLKEKENQNGQFGN